MYKTRLTKEQAEKDTNSLIQMITLVVLGLWVFLLVGCAKPTTETLVFSEMDDPQSKYTKCFADTVNLFVKLDSDLTLNVSNWCYNSTRDAK